MFIFKSKVKKATRTQNQIDIDNACVVTNTVQFKNGETVQDRFEIRIHQKDGESHYLSLSVNEVHRLISELLAAQTIRAFGKEHPTAKFALKNLEMLKIKFPLE